MVLRLVVIAAWLLFSVAAEISPLVPTKSENQTAIPIVADDAPSLIGEKYLLPVEDKEPAISEEETPYDVAAAQESKRLNDPNLDVPDTSTAPDTLDLADTTKNVLSDDGIDSNSGSTTEGYKFRTSMLIVNCSVDRIDDGYTEPLIATLAPLFLVDTSDIILVGSTTKRRRLESLFILVADVEVTVKTESIPPEYRFHLNVFNSYLLAKLTKFISSGEASTRFRSELTELHIVHDSNVRIVAAGYLVASPTASPIYIGDQLYTEEEIVNNNQAASFTSFSDVTITIVSVAMVMLVVTACVLYAVLYKLYQLVSMRKENDRSASNREGGGGGVGGVGGVGVGGGGGGEGWSGDTDSTISSLSAGTYDEQFGIEDLCVSMRIHTQPDFTIGLGTFSFPKGSPPQERDRPEQGMAVDVADATVRSPQSNRGAHPSSPIRVTTPITKPNLMRD